MYVHKQKSGQGEFHLTHSLTHSLTLKLNWFSQKFVKRLFVLFLLVNLIFFSNVAPVLATAKTWDFSSSSDYTFDNTKIEISSGQAQLKAPSDWFNQNWLYRTPITIDNSAGSQTLTNYQAQIDLNSSNFDFTKAKSDGSDIRFTSSDGTTELQFWIESYDSAGQTARFWPKVPSIPVTPATTIYMYYGDSSADPYEYFKISTDSTTHSDYGLSYPITYSFSIPAGSSSLKAYKKYTSSSSWTQITEKTSNDFFNGIEAARFDYTNNRAYVSIAFDSLSDDIYLKLTNISDQIVDVDYLGIPDYYDNRTAAVVVTADDWYWSSATDTQFQLAADAFKNASIWFSVGIMTNYQSQPPNWAHIQSKIDAGYVEPISHSRTHPNVPYSDYDSEIGGSKDDLINNLDFPALNKKGSQEYLYGWIEPYGGSDATARATLGTNKYLADRDVSSDDVYATWDSTNGLFNRIGVSYTMETGNLSGANSKFDSVVAAGGIYHLYGHPENVSWTTGSWILDHIDYIKEKKNLWYVGFGHLYLYHYVDNQNKATVIKTGGSDDTISYPLVYDEFTGSSLDSNYWSTEANGGSGVVTLSGGNATLNPQDNAINSSGVRSVHSHSRLKARLKSTDTTHPYLTLSLGSGNAVGYDAPTSWYYTNLASGYSLVIVSNTHAILTKMTNGANTTLQDRTDLSLDLSNFHEYELIISSSGVSVERDGLSILSGSDTTYSSGYGLIAAGEYSNGFGDTAVIDYIKMSDSSSYTSLPQPSASSGSQSIVYSSDNPTVYPIGSQSYYSLSGFSESATKNGGQIKYQISNDSGTTWYWYSSGWNITTSGYSEANTASEINSNIASFPNGDKSFRFRAYLNSDGTQWVRLDTIDLEYGLPPAGPPVCSDIKPSSAPWLYAATTKNQGSILLEFTKVENNVNKYAIEYGLESGKYIYAADNIGDANTTEYLVKDLQPNTTYYFRVRAGNGCATGDWSNEISATTSLSSAKQLKITETTLEPVVLKQPVSCQEYTVQSGDNLWSIAKSELGDGALYTKIVELNKEKYPSLATSNNLEVGWKLNLCQPEINESEAQEENEGQIEGYKVNVKVTDTNQQPVQGAKVTIHSKVQESTTDENGIARFENVEPGDHRVLIAYSGYEGEQSINLTGDVKEFNLNITVEQKPFSLSPLAYAIIGTLGTVVFVLIVLLIRSKRNRR